MSLLALTSAKGSPGVTTLALRLADVFARRLADAGHATPVVLVEADTSGGDLAARRGLAGAPGLASLALSARRSLGPTDVLDHCQRLGAVHVLAGVAGYRQGNVVAPVLPRVLEALRGIDAFVVVDAGRLAPAPAEAPVLLRAADLVALVTRTTTEHVVHARSAVDALRSHAVHAELVLVGRPEFASGSIATSVGAPVLAVVADAPGEAAGDPSGSRRRRGDLARSVDALVGVLAPRLARSAPPTAAGAPSAPPTAEEERRGTSVVQLRAVRAAGTRGAPA